MLQQNPAEVDALFRDLLIGVTNFFRDPEAFAGFENPGDSAPIRRQAAGQRDPGLGVRLLHRRGSLFHRHPLQEHMEAAEAETSRCRYLPPISTSGPSTCPHRQSFLSALPPTSSAGTTGALFHLDADGVYRIQKRIRDMVIFSEQDVIRDPPFSKLDLISCRNLLIYLNADLQKKLIPLFHYALNPEEFCSWERPKPWASLRRIFDSARPQIETLSAQAGRYGHAARRRSATSFRHRRKPGHSCGRTAARAAPTIRSACAS